MTNEQLNAINELIETKVYKKLGFLQPRPYTTNYELAFQALQELDGFVEVQIFRYRDPAPYWYASVRVQETWPYSVAYGSDGKTILIAICLAILKAKHVIAVIEDDHEVS